MLAARNVAVVERGADSDAVVIDGLTEGEAIIKIPVLC